MTELVERVQADELAAAIMARLRQDGLIAWDQAELQDEWEALTLTPMIAAEIERLTARMGELEAALKPFADCVDQINDDEDDEEWAKFRLLIGDYRRARRAL